MTLLRLFAPLLALIALVSAGVAFAQPAFPERGTASVVDQADVLDPATEAQLSARLDAFEQANQRQFVVATVDSLQGYDIADYGYQLGRFWALGDAENDDGIILLVAPNERKVRIEVGYGLEAILPDGLAYNIVEGDIIPRFKQGDMPGGIVAGADAIIRQLELPPEQAAAIAQRASQAPARASSGIPFGLVFWMFILFFFFILPMIRRGGQRYRRTGSIGDVILWSAINAAANSSRSGRGSSWGGGGFSGGGGGFSGGGGSFGGGGASGSW